MKRILTTLLTFTYLSSFAQAPDFPDLLMLFVDQKYDKCLSKCEKYQKKDDTKREPMTYFYEARCLYMISQDASWVEKDDAYKRAFDNSIRAAATFAKKDKKKKEHMYKEDVREFFEELKGAVLEDVDSYMHGEKQKFSKAASELKRLSTFAPNDVGALLMRGVCLQRSQNISEAINVFREADAQLDSLNFKKDVMGLDDDESLTDITNWEKELERNNTARLLMAGLIESAKFYQERNQKERAIFYIDKGKQWFENVEAYMEVYNSIVN